VISHFSARTPSVNSPILVDVQEILQEVEIAFCPRTLKAPFASDFLKTFTCYQITAVALKFNDAKLLRLKWHPM